MVSSKLNRQLTSESPDSHTWPSTSTYAIMRTPSASLCGQLNFSGLLFFCLFVLLSYEWLLILSKGQEFTMTHTKTKPTTVTAKYQLDIWGLVTGYATLNSFSLWSLPSPLPTYFAQYCVHY